jgi:HEAT repeat protein
MNKWYRPFGLVLLAAMAGNLCGCAQTSGLLTKKPTKKTSEEKLADSKDSKKKTTREKDSKGKNSKELADLKSDESKSALGGPKSGKTKGKSTKANDTKVVSASKTDAPKKTKPRVDPLAAEDSADAMASATSTKTKSKPTTRRSDDDLDTFLSSIENPKGKTGKDKAAVKEKSLDEFDQPSGNDVRKNVVQVKKEVESSSEGFDGDIADWAEEKSSPAGSSVKSAQTSKVTPSFDEEPISTAGDNSAADDEKFVSTEESHKPTIDSPRKHIANSRTGRGMQDLCPNADGDLAVLLKDIDLSDAESIKQGLHQIGQMGDKGLAAAPLLQKLLKHDDQYVRAHSALTMARLKLTNVESIKVVTESLKSRDASLRSFASAVLGEMGPQSNKVLTSLAESLNDKDGQVRLRAAEVLIRHDGFAYPALQSLLASLADGDENIRWLTTYSLAELAPESPEAVQALIKASHDPAVKVQVGAVYALGEIGPYAKRATSELRKVFKSSNDEELKAAIVYSLEQIEK